MKVNLISFSTLISNIFFPLGELGFLGVFFFLGENLSPQIFLILLFPFFVFFLPKWAKRIIQLLYVYVFFLKIVRAWD